MSKTAIRTLSLVSAAMLALTLAPSAQAENEATTAARHTTIKTSKGAYLNLSLTTGHQSIWYKAYLSDRHRGNGVKALHFDSVQYLTDKTTVVTGKTVRTRATGSAVTFRRSGLGQYGGSDKEYFRLRTWVCEKSCSGKMYGPWVRIYN